VDCGDRVGADSAGEMSIYKNRNLRKHCRLLPLQAGEYEALTPTAPSVVRRTSDSHARQAPGRGSQKLRDRSQRHRTREI